MNKRRRGDGGDAGGRRVKKVGQRKAMRADGWGEMMDGVQWAVVRGRAGEEV